VLGSFAAYTLWRQFVLRLGAEPRRSSIGGTLTAAVAAVVLIGDLVVPLGAGHQAKAGRRVTHCAAG
jgi:hypothetical protein